MRSECQHALRMSALLTICTAAYKEAEGIKIGGRRIMVDVERGRTVKDWKPMRLGGGLGGATRKKKEVAPPPDMMCECACCRTPGLCSPSHSRRWLPRRLPRWVPGWLRRTGRRLCSARRLRATRRLWRPTGRRLRRPAGRRLRRSARWLRTTRRLRRRTARARRLCAKGRLWRPAGVSAAGVSERLAADASYLQPWRRRWRVRRAAAGRTAGSWVSTLRAALSLPSLTNTPQLRWRVRRPAGRRTAQRRRLWAQRRPAGQARALLKHLQAAPCWIWKRHRPADGHVTHTLRGTRRSCRPRAR
jgi:hypothetical protein